MNTRPLSDHPIDAHTGLARVLADVTAEREAQHAVHGVQHHLADGTGTQWRAFAEHMRTECERAAVEGRMTWRHILLEEVAEAVAEDEPDRIRSELVQAAAVAVQWLQAIDQRPAGRTPAVVQRQQEQTSIAVNVRHYKGFTRPDHAEACQPRTSTLAENLLTNPTRKGFPMEHAERITIIGSGCVGLTTGACLASLGHTVTCIDRDEPTIAALRAGRSHLAEPGIEPLLRDGLDTNRLQFDTTPDPAITTASLVILCLPTPPARDGSVVLTAIRNTVLRIRDLLPTDAVVVTKSTTPVGTTATITSWLRRDDIAVVVNPEFLREGHAVYDFLHPTRIVIGSDDHTAAKRVAALYDAVRTEMIFTNPATAELAKYAANCYLATRLSYNNSVAELCEVLNADHSDLTYILGADPRIGGDYLKPGPGWGGPCLPKDVHALVHQAREAGVPFPILDATIGSNQHHLKRTVQRLQEELGHELAGTRIALLGLTFKADTDDLRNSPAMHVAYALIELGVRVTAHDPAIKDDIPTLDVVPTVDAAVNNVDALVLLTDWPEYRWVDWTSVATLMAGKLVLDTRNALAPKSVADAGLRYVGVGVRESMPT